MQKSWTCEKDVLCGVNIAHDMSNKTEIEKKHLPVIDAPQRVAKDEPFEVRIEAGKLSDHPNQPGHFIEWIELYCGDTFLGRALFCGGTSFPQAVFKIRLSHAHGPLKAWAKCNLEGLWESTKDIIVE